MPHRYVRGAAVCAGLVVILSASGFRQGADIGKAPIERFAEVDKNLFRGAQPDPKDYQFLKDLGIKKVINFRTEEDLAADERGKVESLGMEYVHIPWEIYASYDHAAFVRFFEAIKDKDENPVFFHCRRGSERTGVMSGAYKMKFSGMSFEDAYRDAIKYDVMMMWRVFVKSKLKEFSKRTREGGE
ncbi:tyrosine-protein phosphatase [Fibrobacterota bacterium]